MKSEPKVVYVVSLVSSRGGYCYPTSVFTDRAEADSYAKVAKEVQIVRDKTCYCFVSELTLDESVGHKAMKIYVCELETVFTGYEYEIIERHNSALFEPADPESAAPTFEPEEFGEGQFYGSSFISAEDAYEKALEKIRNV